MKFIRKLVNWIFRLNGFRISILLMFTFLFLYILAFRGKIETFALVELKAYDLRFQATNRMSKLGLIGKYFKQKPSDKIVIAEIDDRAVDYLDWPFPRGKWGAFIDRMNEYGAAVVAFDVVFDKPGEYAGFDYIEAIEKKYADLGVTEYLNKEDNGVPDDFARLLRDYEDFVKAKRLEVDQDLIFAKSLEKSQIKVVLGWFGYLQEKEAKALKQKDFSAEAEMLKPSSLSVSLNETPWERMLRTLGSNKIMGITPPIALLGEKSEYFGFFTSKPESLDGTLRKAPMVCFFTTDENNPTGMNTFVYPSLSLAALAAYYSEKPLVSIQSINAKAIIKSIKIGKVEVPTDEAGSFLINWMGNNKVDHIYDTYSVYDIITGFTNLKEGAKKIDPKKAFKGKIVMVGSSAIGAHDMRTTPFGTAPGVEMHVNMISNILEGNSLRTKQWFKMFDLLFILIVGVLFGLILPRVSAVWGGIVTLIFFLGYIATNIYLFLVMHYPFTIVFPLAEILFIFIAVTIFRYATEEREKRFIKGAFEHYLSPEVISDLMKDTSKLKLGGDDKVLTAFFSDIQGFSSFSENMKTQDLVHFLNIYLTEMCDIILDYAGTIDKFEGDAIIAFFGAPVDMPDHAAKACLCSAEIQKKMNVLRTQWMEEGWPEVHMRIGLNTGQMMVGNMGSRDRMDYTIMGDSVNLAARLEGAGKQYKVYSMIGEDTKKAAGDVVEYRELDMIRVKGKKKPVTVYEILGKTGEVDQKKLEVARIFEKGLEQYRQRYWMEARALFEKALELDPSDGPSIVFLARCEEYSDNPPSSGWDGVYTMTTK